MAVQQTREQYSLILPSACGLLTPSTCRLPTQWMKPTLPIGLAVVLRQAPARLHAGQPLDEVGQRDDLRDATVAVLALGRHVVLVAGGDDDGAGLDREQAAAVGRRPAVAIGRVAVDREGGLERRCLDDGLPSARAATVDRDVALERAILAGVAAFAAADQRGAVGGLTRR